jgi:hypothetical protein
MDNCDCKVHVFRSPPSIGRTERQQSVFSITTFKDNAAVKPLDQLGHTGDYLRKFQIPSQMKAPLRRLLSWLHLDAYSVYGDPDSFGKSLSVRLDFSDLHLENIPSASDNNNSATS